MLVSLLWLGVAGAGVARAQTAPTPLPDEMRLQYIAACFGAVDRHDDDMNQAATLCPCTLRALESVLTPSEYAALVGAARAGAPPPPPPAALPRLEQDVQGCHQSAAVAAGAPLPASVQMAGMSVPLPAGFFAPETMGPGVGVEAVRAGGGLVLVQRRRAPVEHAFRASIVILPTDGPPPVAEEDCKAFADQTPGVAQSVAVVRGASGPRCEVKKMAAEPPTRGATFAALGTSTRGWAVTCNYDVRDQASIQACSDVLEGLKY